MTLTKLARYLFALLGPLALTGFILYVVTWLLVFTTSGALGYSITVIAFVTTSTLISSFVALQLQRVVYNSMIKNKQLHLFRFDSFERQLDRKAIKFMLLFPGLSMFEKLVVVKFKMKDDGAVYGLLTEERIKILEESKDKFIVSSNTRGDFIGLGDAIMENYIPDDFGIED